MTTHPLECESPRRIITVYRDPATGWINACKVRCHCGQVYIVYFPPMPTPPPSSAPAPK